MPWRGRVNGSDEGGWVLAAVGDGSRPGPPRVWTRDSRWSTSGALRDPWSIGVVVRPKSTADR